MKPEGKNELSRRPCKCILCRSFEFFRGREDLDERHADPPSPFLFYNAPLVVTVEKLAGPSSTPAVVRNRAVGRLRSLEVVVRHFWSW